MKRCFQSLESQTDMRFEWIIVDDGSTDNTEAIVHSFNTDRFPVCYIRKQNGGKHTALNASQSSIHGEYVLILDSDDYLVHTAVNQVLTEWSKYSDNGEIGVLTFLRGTDTHNPLCTVNDFDTPVDLMTYPRNCLKSNDCCEVIRTELFKRFPFPEFSEEKFVSECALWDRVSFVSKCVYVNSVIYICEYLEGGLTKSGRSMRVRNPRGGMYTSDIRMDTKGSLKQRVKNGLLYTCYGFFAEMTPREMSSCCRAKSLMWLCMPFGWGMYLYWKKAYK